MPEQQPNPFGMMSVAQVCVFSFAVDDLGNEYPKETSPTVIGSKDSIIWALCVERFCAKHSYLTLDQMISEFDRLFQGKIEEFIGAFAPSEGRFRMRLSPYPVPLAAYEELFEFRPRTLSSRRIEGLRSQERVLEAQGLIRDPFTIEIPGILLVILGFVPTEFSIKTVEGKELAVKVKALLWELQMEKGEHSWKVDGRFKAFQLAELLKKRIGEATKKLDDKRDG